MQSLWIASSVLVWAAHFAALYGFTALACARGMAGAVPWVAGGATLAAIAALALIAWLHSQQRGEFNAWLALALAGLALIAVVYETVPLFIVPICA
jgi:hypothetical protein